MSIRKVLIVDDSATDLKKLEQIVSGAGYTVITAVSGKEALERVKADRPDAVLLDIIMNDLNGFQVCRAIHSDETTKNTPVVLVSSKREKIDQVWGVEQGAVGYVMKPFTPEQILDQLRAL
ncbi:MAG: PleD family two-component system response regulator [Sulfurifustaceae bacterium]